MSMSGKEEEGGSNEHIATDKDFYYYETDHQTLPDDQAATADYGPDPEEVEDEGRNRDLNDNEPTVSALDEVFYDSSDRDPLPNASVHGHPDPGMSVMDGTDNKDPDPDVSVAPAAESPIAADAAIKSEKRIPPISPIVKVTQRESLFTPLTNLAASGSKPMKKFPPPYPQLIYGYHRNDILSGRGATINAHPGNKHFRVMCAHRKSEFEPATNSQKRQIAFEIVQAVMKWNPPGRFIERAERNAKCTAEDVDAFFREVDVNRVLVGSSAAYFHQMGYSLKRNRKLKRELGPWKDIGIEMAIQKAMSVIRDHDRADRIALRAMGMLRRKKLKTYPQKQNDSYLSAPMVGEDGLLIPIQAAIDGAAQDNGISPVYSDLVPTQNDVLLGRGAFINEHEGNRQFRSFALERKLQFDTATPTNRRTISREIVTLTKELHPPGRFLRRSPFAQQGPILLSDGKSYRLPPRGLEGPWEEVSDEKACAKATQVLRDLKMKVQKSNDTVYQEAMQVQATASVAESIMNDVELPEPPIMADVNNDPLQHDVEGMGKDSLQL